MASGKPIYGMHRGTVGFLMNEFSEDGLRERLDAARIATHPPAADECRPDAQGRTHEFHAFNEVSLFRQTYQAARLRILIDGQERLAELVARRHPGGDAGRLDRLQPLGRRAHHPDQRLAAGGDADQPVPARRRWRGAPCCRIPPASASRSASAASVRSPRWRTTTRFARCSRSMSGWIRSIGMPMLFDPGHSLDDRILREQFGY